MKPSEIEYWTHQLMDLVESGHAVEDRGEHARGRLRDAIAGELKPFKAAHRQ